MYRAVWENMASCLGEDFPPSFSLFELTSNMSQCVFSDMPAMWMAHATNTIELNVCVCVSVDQ